MPNPLEKTSVNYVRNFDMELGILSKHDNFWNGYLVVNKQGELEKVGLFNYIFGPLLGFYSSNPEDIKMVVRNYTILHQNDITKDNIYLMGKLVENSGLLQDVGMTRLFRAITNKFLPKSEEPSKPISPEREKHEPEAPLSTPESQVEIESQEPSKDASSLKNSNKIPKAEHFKPDSKAYNEFTKLIKKDLKNSVLKDYPRHPEEPIEQGKSIPGYDIKTKAVAASEELRQKIENRSLKAKAEKSQREATEHLQPKVPSVQSAADAPKPQAPAAEARASDANVSESKYRRQNEKFFKNLESGFALLNLKKTLMENWRKASQEVFDAGLGDLLSDSKKIDLGSFFLIGFEFDDSLSAVETYIVINNYIRLLEENKTIHSYLVNLDSFKSFNKDWHSLRDLVVKLYIEEGNNQKTADSISEEYLKKISKNEEKKEFFKMVKNFYPQSKYDQ